MIKIKKALRLAIFTFMVVLASIGVGIAGAVPISTFERQYNKEENNIEKIDKEKEEK